jgi:hypothetical protein
MDQSKSDKITLRIAPDVRRSLELWAHENLSTMTAELNRSIRLRAAQECRAEEAALIKEQPERSELVSRPHPFNLIGPNGEKPDVIPDGWLWSEKKRTLYRKPNEPSDEQRAASASNAQALARHVMGRRYPKAAPKPAKKSKSKGSKSSKS